MHFYNLGITEDERYLACPLDREGLTVATHVTDRKPLKRRKFPRSWLAALCFKVVVAFWGIHEQLYPASGAGFLEAQFLRDLHFRDIRGIEPGFVLLEANAITLFTQHIVQ